MTANEIEIATADEIIINHGSEDFPETDLYIRQSSLMKYRRIKMGQPTVDLSQQIIAEIVCRLFKQKLVEDYSIQYEEQVDHQWQNLPTKKVAYLYLKEVNSCEN